MKKIVKIGFDCGNETDIYLIELDVPKKVAINKIKKEIEKANTSLHNLNENEKGGYYDLGFNVDTLMDEVCKVNEGWSWKNIDNEIVDIDVY